MIEAVLFDGDDTLWDYQESMRLALAATLQELETRHPDRAVDTITTDRLARIRDRVADELEGRVLDLAAVRVAAFDRALEELGIVEEGLADELAAFYFSYRANHAGLFDDTIACLDALAHLRIGLVTNGKAAMLDRAGLAERFEVVVRATDVGVAKPHPAIFHHALDAMNLSPGAVVFVGDSEDHDVAGAQAVGMTAILLDRTNSATDSQADRVVSSLEELPSVMNSLSDLSY